MKSNFVYSFLLIIICTSNCKKESIENLNSIPKANFLLKYSYFENTEFVVKEIDSVLLQKDTIYIPYNVSIGINDKSIHASKYLLSLFVNNKLINPIMDGNINRGFSFEIKNDPVTIKYIVKNREQINSNSDSLKKVIVPISSKKGKWQFVLSSPSDVISRSDINDYYIFDNKLYYFTNNLTIKESDDLGKSWQEITIPFIEKEIILNDYNILPIKVEVIKRNVLIEVGWYFTYSYNQKNKIWVKTKFPNLIDLFTDNNNSRFYVKQTRPYLILNSLNGLVWDTLHFEKDIYNSESIFGLNNNKLYAVSHDVGTTNNYTYCSKDSGKNWIPICDRLESIYFNEDVFCGIARNIDNIWIAYSKDNGEHVFINNTDYYAYDKTYGIQLYDNKLFFYIRHDIYISYDYGATFINISDNLRGIETYYRKIIGIINGYIYISVGNDVYKRSLDEFNK